VAPPPTIKVLYSLDGKKQLTFFDIDEVEAARQLTIRCWELWSAIKVPEFFNFNWSKPQTQHLAANLLAFIDYFNFISRGVSSTLILVTKVRKRRKMLMRLIKIAMELKKLKNFHMLQAFVCGLGNSAVSRLKWTKEKVRKRFKQQLTELETLMSMEGSYKHYRQALESCATSLPAIPYVGVCLTDLTFIEEGNRDTIGNLINFSKHRLVYKVINGVLETYQGKGYNLQKENKIQQFLSSLPQIDDAALYNKSLELEPRNAAQHEIS